MDITVSEISTAVNKALNWLRLGMVPTGTIIVGLYTEPPEGFIAFKKTSKILKSDYPALCEILFKLEAFKGDGLTYATIPDVDHRVLEMCSNVSEVGQLIEAGLPDITGNLTDVAGGATMSFNGRALTGDVTDNSEVFGTTGNGRFASITLQAKRCSDAYGNSTTVQPSSLRLMPIIRT